MKSYKLTCFFIFLSAFVFAQQPSCLEKTVIIKVKEQYRSACDDSGIHLPVLSGIFDNLGMNKITRKFPRASVPGNSRSKDGHKLIDLSLIYEIEYSANTALIKAIQILTSTGVFEYAEPHYVPTLSYNPNDPGATRSIQYYLTNIKAYEAWDLQKGDTNVVVGITDTGTDLTHPELNTSVKRNYLDPVDGIDNDLDGYIDNFLGWDMGENDNNPNWAVIAHGVHVSGLASAVTDNATGMAGTGFRCKYLPVKISNGNGSLTAAYEGIVYAADHGCKVINCSWGGTGGGQFGQDIVDYAVFNKDALVVSAAGNDNKLINFYPASFKHVLDIAATDSTDMKAAFSNYSCAVDLSAPGAAIYSTWPNGYLYSNGTSMAAPIVAGAAAITRSSLPSYTALQILEQLKATADTIYHINAFYTDYLGTGRLNMFRAITESGMPGIDLEDHEETNNGTNIFASGDTVRVTTLLKNYLSASQNLSLTLRSASTYVTIIDSTYNMNPLQTFGQDSNTSDPFEVYIKPTAPTNGLVRLKLIVTDGTYTTSFCFDITVNVDYINVMVNDVATTITSRGKIGYNNNNRTNGLGFVYNDQVQMLYEAGVMIGNSTSAVSDPVRGTNQAVSERDFYSLQNVRERIPATVSEYDLIGVMNDDSAGISKLNIEVTQTTYAWSTPGNTRYVIVRYSLRNSSTLPLLNVYTGIFADWDIQNAAQNRAAFDVSNRMGYCTGSGSSPFFSGIKVLSSGPAICYSIDNVQGGNGGIDITDGYSTSEKFTTLTTHKPSAGQTGGGTDIIQVVSSGPFTLLPGDSVAVAFALIGGENLPDIQTSGFNAQQKYNQAFPIGIKEIAVLNNRPFPNPASSDNGKLSVTCESQGSATIRIIDQAGRIIREYQKETGSGSRIIQCDISGIAPGAYHVVVNQGALVNTAPVIILP